MLRPILRKYWGYDSFRPLQDQAMQCVVEGQDSVVVMPTGGGKSLCFQAPAVHLPGLAVVVSPLIALMMDQVRSLQDNGVAAACITSMSSDEDRAQAAQQVRAGQLKLLYLSPERLMTQRMLDFLGKHPPSFFAIDEAHCISDWGHDFRPEYRTLRQLKELFPEVAVHAYTATATPDVQQDIARQLQLWQPKFLIGSFDRPNLIYRVQRRGDLLAQAREVIDRHAAAPGIIYCIRRAEVEKLCAELCQLGHKAVGYHAGMSDDDRRANQEAFANDSAKIVVATVAFGMGIDKSNVRYVIHAAAPKSLEAYQQESGRGGRDGLEAECWLFYSAADFVVWRKFQDQLSGQAATIAQTVLAGMERFCTSVACRHRSIVRYFGQDLPGESCDACDVCLDEMEWLDDSLVMAQKILSCVVRLEQNFGADYTALVLTGSKEQRILDKGHDRLSTWNLLGDCDKRAVREWIEQLVGQEFLERVGEYGVLHLTPAGRQVLRGELTPRLLKTAVATRKTSRAATASWAGVDKGLFEGLRVLRKQIAQERQLPPFIVFNDATLRDMARRRPSTTGGMLKVSGVGDRKLEEYGHAFLQAIQEHCESAAIDMDVDVQDTREHSPENNTANKQTTVKVTSSVQQQANALFAAGNSVEEVQQIMGRARSTTMGYLADYLATACVTDPTPWVDAETVARIMAAAVGEDRLKPIFEALGGEVSYDQIRIALVCHQNAAGAD